MAKEAKFPLTTMDAEQELKFFQMLDKAAEAAPIGKYDKKILDNGLIKGTGLHWYQVAVQYLPAVLFYDFPIRRERIFTSGVVIQNEHIIDATYEPFKEVYIKKKSATATEPLTGFSDFPFTILDVNEEQKVLELFDFCEKIKNLMPASYEAELTGSFFKGTKLHWFQALYEHFMKIILNDEKLTWQFNLCRYSLGTLNRSPVNYLYDKHDRKLNKISFYDNLQNDFVKENQDREDRRIERAKAQKLKEKYAEK